ncbi:LamG-like jellyroll fold domain-containing protein [Catenovulum agarivorans]|uniref:LamG-like jellyroll fold domain-containing protein n=1 Tax=Catenovulum agarivorans TaxID=1172192 RepID=UPI0002D466BC|nr:LamG-like jellyroll fold domain-containing protein [Catenovulum agarivorans]
MNKSKLSAAAILIAALQATFNAQAITPNALVLDQGDKLQSATLPTDTHNATIEFWFKTADADSGLLRLNKTTSKSALSVRLNQGKIEVADNPISQVFLVSDDTYADDKWHHLALTAQAETSSKILTLTLYVDGKALKSYQLNNGTDKAYFSQAQLTFFSADYYQGLRADYYNDSKRKICYGRVEPFDDFRHNCHSEMDAFDGYQYSQWVHHAGSAIDKNINFNFGDSGAQTLSGKTNTDNFTARWQGFVVAAETGDYTFKTLSDDGLKLWVSDVSGTPKIDVWRDGGGITGQATINLIQGSFTPIKLEYYDNAGGANVSLSWKTPSGVEQVIPTENLYWQQSSAAMSISQPRVWNSARSADEIVNSFKVNLIGNETGLLINSQFSQIEQTTPAAKFLNQAGHANEFALITNKTASTKLVAATDLTLNSASKGQSAMRFTGSASTVLTDSNASYSSLIANSSFTVEAWVKNQLPVTTSSNMNPAIAISGAYANSSFVMGFNQGKLYCATQNNQQDFVSETSVVAGYPWIHFACSYDKDSNGGTLTIYRNGLQVGQKTNVKTAVATGALSVGSNGFEQYFTGEIDELRVWQTARTQQDIRSNMSQRLIQQTADLVVQQTLDTPVSSDTQSSYTFNDSFSAGNLVSTEASVSPQLQSWGVKLENINLDGYIPVLGEYALNFSTAEQQATWDLSAKQADLATAFTASLWLNVAQNNALEQFVAGSNQWHITRLTDGKIAVYVNQQSTPVLTSTSILSHNQWHNLALIYSNNRLSLLVNGEAEATAEVGSLLSNLFELGKATSATSLAGLTGAIDQVQLWSKALTAEQLKLLFKIELTGAEPNLVLAQNFNQSLFSPTAGLTLNKASLSKFSSTHLITGLGFAEIDLNQAFYFDGVDDALTTQAVSLDVQNGITIDFWTRMASSGQSASLLEQVDGDNALKIGVTSSDAFYCELNGQRVTTEAAELDLTWHHWTCKFYINSDNKLAIDVLKDGAVLAANTFDSTSYASSQPFILGTQGQGFYHGWLDELHIWSRSLPLADLIALQKATPTKDSQGIVASWHFNDVFAGNYTDVVSGNNATAADNSAPTTAVGIRFSNSPIILGSNMPVGELKTGLWQGRVVVGEVNESHFEAGADAVSKPTQAGSTFLLPFLLHANTTQTNILSEVTLMQTKESEGSVRPVLITDQSLLANYDGMVRKNGKLVGVRLSAVPFILDYDSASKKVKTQQIMQGGVGEGGKVSVLLTYAADHPLNPYRHIYHPDLDKGFEIKRHIEFTFDEYTAEQRAQNSKLGVNELTGVYVEKVTGLHQQSKNGELAPIISKGRFSMQLVSTVNQLNQ